MKILEILKNLPKKQIIILVFAIIAALIVVSNFLKNS